MAGGKADELVVATLGVLPFGRRRKL
jgi:hypothetical protein